VQQHSSSSSSHEAGGWESVTLNAWQISSSALYLQERNGVQVVLWCCWGWASVCGTTQQLQLHLVN